MEPGDRPLATMQGRLFRYLDEQAFCYNTRKDERGDSNNHCPFKPINISPELVAAAKLMIKPNEWM